MRAFLLACAAIAVISVGAWYGLTEVYNSSGTQLESDSVRLD